MVQWTITVGNIFEIAAILIGGAIAVASVRWRMDLIEKDVAGVKIELHTLTGVLTDVAVQNQRILNLEHRLDQVDRK